MSQHYLESALYAIAQLVKEDDVKREKAIDVLETMFEFGNDYARQPLFVDIWHDGSITASRYEFDNVGSAFDAVLENFAEFDQQ